MLAQFESAATTFAHGDRAFDRLVGDFTAQDWAVRDAAGHDPRWIAGHLAATRNRAAALMGWPVAGAPWEAAFGRGTSPADLPADLDMASVLAAFHAAGAAMASGWEALTVEAMAVPLGRTLPDGSDTVGGAIRFLAWHEAYHLGQLGLLRRLAGKPGRA